MSEEALSEGEYQNLIVAGRRLRMLRESSAWRGRYSSFEDYVNDLGFELDGYTITVLIDLAEDSDGRDKAHLERSLLQEMPEGHWRDNG